MKIALCFSGQARAIKTGFEYYKRNLLDLYDVDVYFHSWNSENNQVYLDTYKPKNFKFEDALNVDLSKYTRIPAKRPAKNIYSMYYSMNECRKLIQGNYDWVIRARTDYALNVDLKFHTLDSSKLYIPDEHQNVERDAGNDQFAASSQSNMEKYLSTFENIDRYYDNGCELGGETLMQANLRAHGLIGEKLVYTNMNNPFPPQAYSGWPSSLIREDFLSWNPGARSDW
jgi:hypothetical protein